MSWAQLTDLATHSTLSKRSSNMTRTPRRSSAGSRGGNREGRAETAIRSHRSLRDREVGRAGQRLPQRQSGVQARRQTSGGGVRKRALHVHPNTRSRPSGAEVALSFAWGRAFGPPPRISMPSKPQAIPSGASCTIQQVMSHYLRVNVSVPIRAPS